MQGRDFQNLLELRPGIQRTPGGGFHSVTTNGNRFEDNNYTVDGTDDNDIYYGESVINDVGVSRERLPAICRSTPSRSSTPRRIRARNTDGNPARW